MVFDPHYASVSLLLHCDGADGSTAFADTSGVPKPVSTSGAVQISTAQSKFGGASAYFSGAGGGLTFSGASPGGTEDWTIEALGFVPALPASGKLTMLLNFEQASDAALGVISIELTSAGAVGLYVFPGGSYASGGNFAAGAWHHVAATRQGNTFRLFLDGALLGSFSNTTSFGSIPGAVGFQPAVSGRGWAGYIDDVRVTKGVARYTANFTPPTGPFPDSAPPPTVSAHAACITPLGLPQALAEFAGAARVRASSPGPLAAPSVVVSSTPSLEAAVFESIASTVFGTPALTVSCKALSVGDTTSFGTPVATTFTPPKIHRTTDAASVYTTKFGTPSVAIGAWVVEAGSTAPGTTFGAPVAGTAQAAQPIAPSAAFGLPTSGIALQASGFCSTVFGVPVSGRALRADSITPAGRWGPVASTTYYEHIAGSIPGGPQFSVPSTHWRCLARSVAPTTRFGKPLLRRNTQC